MDLCAPHGRNKIPHKATWWRWETAQDVRALHLATEFLCIGLRGLPISARVHLQNLYGISWLGSSTYCIWQEAWLWIPAEHRPAFIARTYDINPELADSVVDGAYAARIGRCEDLDAMD
ncbi:unnamed protein product [Symbiodinium sp. CCMP2592]|nr:unnamed protein product [Symbiodinium sp. CCMP2592]